jgi:hypothetical protein
VTLAQVLDVTDGLFEQLPHVVVVQVVDDLATLAATDDQPEMTQHPQLMRDRRGLHADGVGELADSLPAASQPTQDPHPAGGRQGLHGVRDRGGEVRVEAFGVVQLAVTHDKPGYLHVRSYVHTIRT